MIYNKKSLVALQLYILYGLLKLKPFRSLGDIFVNHLESPGTKAFTKSEAKDLFSDFHNLKIYTSVTSYDLRIRRTLFLPGFVQKIIPESFGFFLFITGEKPSALLKNRSFYE